MVIVSVYSVLGWSSVEEGSVEAWAVEVCVLAVCCVVEDGCSVFAIERVSSLVSVCLGLSSDSVMPFSPWLSVLLVGSPGVGICTVPGPFFTSFVLRSNHTFRTREHSTVQQICTIHSLNYTALFMYNTSTLCT